VQPPLLAIQVVGIAYPGDILAVVTTRGKPLARRSVGTKTEPPRKDTSVQVSGCRECLSLALVLADSRQLLCSVRAGEQSAQPGGRAEGGSGEVEEHLGV